jgi:peptidoglycan/LPS O-acetylase OafA/YrhL
MASTSSRNVVALTGLRGLAAIWVLLYHVFGYHVFILGLGYAGVDIFFMLSGFILTHVYVADRQLVTRRGYAHFLLVRLARIYPLHLLTLLVLIMIVAVLPQYREFSARNAFSSVALVANFLLVQNWIPGLGASWNSPSWSLSAEWAAYLVFPFILWQARQIASIRNLVGFAFALLPLGAFAFYLAGYRTLDGIGLSGCMRMATEFPAGCLLYLATNKGWKADSRLGPTLFALVIVISSAWPLTQFLLLPAFALMISAAVQEKTWWSNLLGWWPIDFLGEISFSVYLTHLIVLRVLIIFNGYWFGFGRMTFAFLAILIALSVAICTYYTVELPARKLGRRAANWVIAPGELS